jgi:predicted HicB family RNase H-like nuclease
VVLKWLMASRRAYADEYAVRVNRAVELLGGRSPAEAVRALRSEHALSERQARRYVTAARELGGAVAVPERTAVFTVRLAPSLIAGLRQRAQARGLTLSAAVAEAIRLYLGRGHVGERRGGRAR